MALLPILPCPVVKRCIWTPAAKSVTHSRSGRRAIHVVNALLTTRRLCQLQYPDDRTRAGLLAVPELLLLDGRQPTFELTCVGVSPRFTPVPR